jgi:hypothetical protein
VAGYLQACTDATAARRREREPELIIEPVPSAERLRHMEAERRLQGGREARETEEAIAAERAALDAQAPQPEPEAETEPLDEDAPLRVTVHLLGGRIVEHAAEKRWKRWGEWWAVYSDGRQLFAAHMLTGATLEKGGPGANAQEVFALAQARLSQKGEAATLDAIEAYRSTHVGQPDLPEVGLLDEPLDEPADEQADVSADTPAPETLSDERALLGLLRGDYSDLSWLPAKVLNEAHDVFSRSGLRLPAIMREIHRRELLVEPAAQPEPA